MRCKICVSSNGFDMQIEAVVTKEELEHLVLLCKSEVDSMGRITAGFLRLLKLEESIGLATLDQLSNLGKIIYTSYNYDLQFDGLLMAQISGSTAAIIPCECIKILLCNLCFFLNNADLLYQLKTYIRFTRQYLSRFYCEKFTLQVVGV